MPIKEGRIEKPSTRRQSRKFTNELTVVVKEIDFESSAKTAVANTHKKQNPISNRSPICTRLRSAGKRTSIRNGVPTPKKRPMRKSVAPSTFNSNGSTKYEPISISVPQPMPIVGVKHSPVTQNGDCDLNAKPIMDGSRSSESGNRRYCCIM